MSCLFKLVVCSIMWVMLCNVIYNRVPETQSLASIHRCLPVPMAFLNAFSHCSFVVLMFRVVHLSHRGIIVGGIPRRSRVSRSI